jgi:predicted metal-dependent peptidase
MNDKLKKAKIRLVLNEPFFATIALKMKYIEDSTIETCCINGTEIKYNPEFINSLTVDEITGLLAHEVLHVSSLHHLRQGSRDGKTWNKACDYAINPMLQSHKFKLPANGLIDNRFGNMNAEGIYKILKEQEDQNNQQQQQSNEPGQGNGQPKPEDFGQVEQPTKDPGKLTEMEAEAKQMIAQAANAAKQAGKISGDLERLVKELIEAKIDWKEVLNRFVAEQAKNDYTWSKPNTRYLSMGLYLPKLENLELGKIAFSIDTSGSINIELLNQFCSELQEASQLFNFPVTAIHCDNKINKVEELEQDSVIVPVGGGGTSFRPPFEYIESENLEIKAMVYFTDGRCYRYPVEPDYPVLWAVYGNKDFAPPFGEVLSINE